MKHLITRLLGRPAPEAQAIKAEDAMFPPPPYLNEHERIVLRYYPPVRAKNLCGPTQGITPALALESSRDVRSGDVCFAGTRTAIQSVWHLAAMGYDAAEIHQERPEVPRDTIQQALALVRWRDSEGVK